MASALNPDMRVRSTLGTQGTAGRSSRKNLDSTTKVFIFSKLLSTDVMREIWREVTRKKAEARLEGDSRVGAAASSTKAPSVVVLNPHVRGSCVFLGRGQSLISLSKTP